MKTNPKTDQELQELLLLPEGIYNFEIVKAEDKISKSGNEMIVINLKVWDKEGKERLLWDYLLAPFAFKLKHFCKAVGLLNKYESDDLKAIDCLGKSGKVHIVIDPEKPNLNGGVYPAKNTVKDYIKNDVKSNLNPIGIQNNFLNDDIPF